VIDELRRAIQIAEQQPEALQHHIAELIALAIEEAEWDAIVSTPESQDFLAQLAEEARTETEAGTTRDLDELL
jgi:delta 1-pyrroline-5-carboxylate dehydrogenase